MYDNYHYPMGADTPSAPWNQVETPQKDFEAVGVFTLTGTAKISSNDYYIDESPDGSYIDTSDINWHDEFISQAYTPIELIEMYKKELIEKKKFLSDLHEIHKIEGLIKACENYEQEEVDFYEMK